MGPEGQIKGMIPGMIQLTAQMNMKDGDVESQMGRMQAIYNSMNTKERKNIDLLDGNRRRRISRGAGVEVAEVGQFLKQFQMSRDMMKAVGSMGMMGKLQLMKQLMSGNL